MDNYTVIEKGSTSKCWDRTKARDTADTLPVAEYTMIRVYHTNSSKQILPRSQSEWLPVNRAFAAPSPPPEKKLTKNTDNEM